MKKQSLIITSVITMICGCSVIAKPVSTCKTDFDNLSCIRSASSSTNSEMKRILENLYKSVDNVNELKASQIKWTQYKNTYCKEFMGKEAANAQGDGAETVIESCLLNSDKSRLLELKSLNKVYSN